MASFSIFSNKMCRKVAVAVALVAAGVSPAFAACSTAQLAGMWHFSTTLTECYPLNFSINGIGKGNCITYDSPGSEGFPGVYQVVVRATVQRNCNIDATFDKPGKHRRIMAGHLQVTPGEPSWAIGTLEHYGSFYLGRQ